MSGITDAEKQQYLNAFISLGAVNGYLSGAQARNWLVNSKLPIDRLEKIWDLCDIDKDGQLDFDEFSVTLRLVNDLLHGVYPDVPPALPTHLIPQSKILLLTGNLNIGGGGFQPQSQQQGIIALSGLPNLVPQQLPQHFSQGPPPLPPPPPQITPQFPQIPPPIPPPPQLQSTYGSFPTAPLSDDFDWYMPPADKFNYENQYSNNVGSHGYVRFNFFDDLYQTLGIPREECMAAWNLVDVNFEQKFGKDACLVFLHILNQRSKGKRIPDRLPSALKTSLIRGNINYNYNETMDSPSTRRLNSDSGSTRPSYGGGGTKREEEELLRQLSELNEKITQAENRALSSYTSALTSSSSDSQVKSELKELYEFKKKQLSALTDGSMVRNKSLLGEYVRSEQAAVRNLEENLQSLRTQMAILETHFSNSEREFKQLQQDLEAAR